MVRANGQRDGVGKTSGCASAFEHTWTILDSTRVSPYGPAAREMPQAMRPDTRQHLTACSRPSDGMKLPETREKGLRPSLRSEASTSRTVGRDCQAAARLLRSAAALRVTAAADRARSPCGPARRLALVPRRSRRGGALRCRGEPQEQTEPRGEASEKACILGGVHTRRRRRPQPPQALSSYSRSRRQDRIPKTRYVTPPQGGN